MGGVDLMLNNVNLSEDLEQVIETLNMLHNGLHYWQGERGIQELRAKLTDASLKAFLIQEMLP